MRQHARLARPGARDDEQLPALVHDGGPLLRVEPVQELLRVEVRVGAPGARRLGLVGQARQPLGLRGQRRLARVAVRRVVVPARCRAGQARLVARRGGFEAGQGQAVEEGSHRP
nr:hypothetical protein GCM10025730_23420 [Promicromonospora thailandica]